jgi:hypothetical protein
VIETGDPKRTLTRLNVWTVLCLGLVLTTWGLLASLALADAVLSAESASNSAYDPVYTLYTVAVIAAPVIGLVAVIRTRARRRGLGLDSHWLSCCR